MRDRPSRPAAAYGLPALTAFFGVAGTVLGLMSVPVGAAVAVGGAILVASFDIVGRVRAEHERAEAKHRALERIAEAASAFHDRLAEGMPLGGTSVPDGTTRERLAAMIQMLHARTFAFLSGRRWRDWAWLANTLETGRAEVLRAAGLAGGRLPLNDDEGVRAFAGTVEAAASHAYEIASMYAGYDVSEKPQLPRYMPEDRDVDVTVLPAHASFAEEFATVVAELARMESLASAAQVSSS